MTYQGRVYKLEHWKAEKFAWAWVSRIHMHMNGIQWNKKCSVSAPLGIQFQGMGGVIFFLFDIRCLCVVGYAPWCWSLHQLRQWNYHPAPCFDSTHGGAWHSWLGGSVSYACPFPITATSDWISSLNRHSYWLQNSAHFCRLFMYFYMFVCFFSQYKEPDVRDAYLILPASDV